MKKNLMLLLLGLNNLIYAQEFTDVRGDYFGQIPPGDKAEVFAPAIISLANREETGAAFSPDGKEFYFTVWDGRSCKIYYTKLENDTWTEQVVAPFSENRDTLSPFFSLDGNRLYFDCSSTRNIWMVERTTTGWGTPQCLPSPINSNWSDGYYTETANGEVYIHSTRPNGTTIDIWCVRRSADSSLQAENLGPIVNVTGVQDLYPCVAPDGSFLIFSSSRSGGHSYQDLYICFDQGSNEWTAPVNMERSGAQINVVNQHQAYPSLSPDGKYLFFTRHSHSDGGPCDVYWVSTSIIKDIKKMVLPDPNGLIQNTSSGQRFGLIQTAIDYANPDETIVIEPGIHEESFTLDKDITLQSVDPNDPFYIGGTIIQGVPNTPVIELSNNSEACTLAGLTVRVGSVGISGTATDATIRNCRIMDNATHGMELFQESNPRLDHCLITANGQTGVKMHTTADERQTLYCQPTIEDCVIVDNCDLALEGGEPVIIDSLIQD